MKQQLPKFARVIKSGNPTHVQYFITIRLSNLPPPPKKNMRKCATTDLAIGSSVILQPRPLHRFLRSVCQMTSFQCKNVPFGSRKWNFIFWPHPPKTGQFPSEFVGFIICEMAMPAKQMLFCSRATTWSRSSGHMQGQINHCAGCTIGGGPAARGPRTTTAKFSPRCFDVWTYVQEPQVLWLKRNDD